MTDDSPRIPYDWARAECPTCGSAPDTRCRAKSGRTTDAHMKRVDLAFERYAEIRRWRIHNAVIKNLFGGGVQ
ncbi:hypothetical protein I5H85_gp079 [Mycobacterium phage Royals2015]|uniref:DNA-binding phage zinc finger domain-containing protein n=1 Tax=Mycobacterium phage Royals2015 TaxID=2768139 RepID=A0A7G9W179_9CAUD|nr:hypothetical protein I5H85_gp079 [Mycobacterium phage Royals2015]QNO12392.1 hypothetical protein SEA_ROYALS2015_79 [Mycobacterium phage Royals2015]